MNYLEELGFTPDMIAEVLDNTPDKLISLLESQKKLVTENINYLKNLGVKNYQEVFIRFYDMFLLDSSNFKDIFEKYDPEDLITKLEKNVNIVEYL